MYVCVHFIYYHITMLFVRFNNSCICVVYVVAIYIHIFSL